MSKLQGEDDPMTRDQKVGKIRSEIARVLHVLDPEDPRTGTDDTPDRVARMWVDELCVGYTQNVGDILTTFPSEGYGGMVLVKDIPLVSTCEHHMVPFTGVAHVGYFPDKRVVGLSKLARLVNLYARRLQIQERLTLQIVEALQNNLNPRGAMVVVEAEHLCMTIRGVQAPGTRTVTSSVTGLFDTNQEGEKDEFLRLIGK